ncbi:histidinol dehydrogenase [Saprolegnia parasitica CBS 223.65]|uniref:Histidinol dehydrogenase n=1 Tax=Saprolegnia parasitica (strain CBS 223.65) TaxID=695850 RepID=A0A067D2T1_SAPPC|nr:histidinol dehydrogenase [Saprolegnia parasitica CBS 223.65]KDO33061.1 histidinol dehydrogenase [Saprolegnia parasitica CBS 223.65]|eukprot:XP_012195832.1 histidinol dehydrogenase [Saprolegnia parasitica CBS 223.65]
MSGLRVIAPSDVRAFAYDPVEPQALEQARAIVNDVRARGLDAVRDHALRLGDIPSQNAPILYSRKEMQAAFDALPVAEQQLLQRTKQRIEVFAQAQRASIQSFARDIPGGQAGQDVSPMQVAGCYAPGGRYPLPSSVLMTAVTARVAGVATVIVASPRPAPATLAAAYISNADALLAVGGAQAIATLAYGIDGVPPCDIIVGPGNKWVTAAKSLVYGKCAIDMLAGPSECLVVADEAGLAHAATIAADLLAQAEHDTAAVPILVTTSQAVVDAVNAEIASQLAVLPTGATAAVSVGKGFAVLCPTLEAAVEAANILAAEHVEIICTDSTAVAKRIVHYGGLFIGARAAEVLGDYGVGPNHVLPTGGTARYTGGLSVHTFLRIRTWMRIDDAAQSQELVRDAVALARIEGLEGHARAAEKRLV